MVSEKQLENAVVPPAEQLGARLPITSWGAPLKGRVAQLGVTWNYCSRYEICMSTGQLMISRRAGSSVVDSWSFAS